jgi:plasmid stabilization system protein ParE
MPTLLIRAAAETDLLLATEWYETRATGLGTEFLRAVDVCFGLLRRMPQAYQLVAPAVRRARLRRFPFSVYYVATPERIAILAVLHARRDPREWQSRL